MTSGNRGWIRDAIKMVDRESYGLEFIRNGGDVAALEQERDGLKKAVKLWEDFDFDRDSPSQLVQSVLDLMKERDSAEQERDAAQQRATEAEAAVAVLAEALTFYADSESWCVISPTDPIIPSRIETDWGVNARSALNNLSTAVAASMAQRAKMEAFIAAYGRHGTAMEAYYTEGKKNWQLELDHAAQAVIDTWAALSGQPEDGLESR